MCKLPLIWFLFSSLEGCVTVFSGALTVATVLYLIVILVLYCHCVISMSADPTLLMTTCGCDYLYRLKNNFVLPFFWSAEAS